MEETARALVQQLAGMSGTSVRGVWVDGGVGGAARKGSPMVRL